MNSNEKLMHVVVTLNTTTSRSTNYVFGRIVGAIETIIIDNIGANGFPLIVGDRDDPKTYIVRFWATKEQMDTIRATLPRLTNKLAKYQYHTILWRDKDYEEIEENNYEEEGES